ncbi:MAG: PKD domain-containing protein [Solirubrobacterales bacterium]|nr:PKD domain-containing protein [Solirubrobacterales bacterium]
MIRAAAAGALAALALAAPANAATCTVGPGAQYPTIDAAVDVGTCTDVQVAPGTYTEAPIAVTRTGLTISAPQGGVTVTPTGSPAFTLSGADATLRGLAVAEAAGVSGVRITGARATLDGVTVRSPAIAVDTTATGTKVLRSTVVATGATGDALLVRAASTGDVAARVESSILAATGRGTATALRARSQTGSSGDVAVTLVQATVPHRVVLDSGGVAGRVRATATRSIVAAPPAGVTVTASDTATPADKLYRDPAGDFRLRADAPVIDRGGTPAAGESDKDIEGEPRLAGPATDLGADEFHNQAPVAALVAARPRVRQNTPVRLSAATSADPEAAYGGGLARYEWDFGDGATETTTEPSIEHAYPATGTYPTTVKVTDRQGASATSAAVPVTVVDGLAPVLGFAFPRASAAIAGTGRLRFSGVARDRSGIRSVQLSLRRTRPASAAATTRRCRYLNPARKRLVTRSCSRPLFFTVTYRKGRWRYDTRGRFRLSPGRWQATIRARDRAGNQGTRTVKFAVR